MKKKTILLNIWDIFLEQFEELFQKFFIIDFGLKAGYISLDFDINNV